MVKHMLFYASTNLVNLKCAWLREPKISLLRLAALIKSLTLEIIIRFFVRKET